MMREWKPHFFSKAASICFVSVAASPVLRPKHGIAALHIGGDIGKAEILEERPQLRHLDDAVAADIDAGKQRNEDFS